MSSQEKPRPVPHRVIGIIALSLGTSAMECPTNNVGGVPSTGFPKTVAWTQRTINDAAGVRPNDMVFADFDGDGSIDVAVAYAGFDTTPARYVVFFRSADGSFTAVPLLGTTAVIPVGAALAAADMNGDGRTDLVAATDQGILFLLSPADPRDGGAWLGFVLDGSDDPAIGGWRGIRIGDIDGANGPDIVAAGGVVGRVSWFRSPAADVSSGSGWTRVDVDAVGRTNARSVTLIDLNNDNRLDIVSTAPGEAADRIAWYANPANPATDVWPRFPIGNLPAAGRVALGDLNVDGRIDVIVLNGPGRQVGWYVRPVDATQVWAGFQITQYGAATPVDLSVADVDGNGQPDVIVATRQPGSMRWFTPLGVQTDVWTENNLRDLNENISAIGVSDLDADGRPDVAGLLLGADVSGDGIAWFENPEP